MTSFLTVLDTNYAKRGLKKHLFRFFSMCVCALDPLRRSGIIWRWWRITDEMKWKQLLMFYCFLFHESESMCQVSMAISIRELTFQYVFYQMSHILTVLNEICSFKACLGNLWHIVGQSLMCKYVRKVVFIIFCKFGIVTKYKS